MPALLEVPTGETPLRVPTGAVQVLVTTYLAPSPATSVELRAGRVEHVHNALDLAASLAESALDEPEARAHLATGQVMYSPPLPVVSITVQQVQARTPWWLPHVVAVAAVAAAVWPWSVDHVAAGIGGSARVEYTYPMADDSARYMTDLVEFRQPVRAMGGKPLCTKVPKEPLPGQDLPPCRSPAEPLHGGCWVKIDKRPNPCCPENAAESEGACFIGLRGGAPMKIPTRIDRRGP
ncbi:hypothetical protein [Myxococcus sp. AS-1-15]|uniref:hypothetical protein n=1 Tax=Myxococcus sp. AS-1-15 TaxID=2874600 RepID=UPI001CBC446B|nr:hypothetical protein [Myxococcus sp. AS-1-15]MBZ4398662.1 hypothetical protein [Myxococcus sp. AS-1-15]